MVGTTRRGLLAGMGAGVLGLAGSVVSAGGGDLVQPGVIDTLSPIVPVGPSAKSPEAVRFDAVGRRSISLTFPEGSPQSGRDERPTHLHVFARPIGRGRVVAHGVAEITAGEPSLTLPLRWFSLEAHTALVLHAIATDTDVIEEVTPDRAAHLHSSDPLVWNPGNAAPSRAAVAPTVSGHHVTDLEGRFRLRFEPSPTSDHPIRLDVAKWAVLEGRLRRRPWYVEPIQRRWTYVESARASGAARTLASVLDAAARAAGMTDPRDRARFAVRFAQSLAYRRDPKSMGVRDYSRHVEETLVDGGGDCVDTSILLASILSSHPFGYEIAFLAPPSHLAVGIHATEHDGWYAAASGRRYFYVETTGYGWSVGSIPSRYRDETVQIFQHPFSSRGRPF